MKKTKNSIKEFFLNRKKSYNELLITTFLIGVLLIVSTYAWFSASLNVKIDFLNLIVVNENGLSISFDAINYTNSVKISEESLITDLFKTYPKHTNQWVSRGLLPVSSNGIPDKNSDKFRMFGNSKVGYISTDEKDRKTLNTELIDETLANNKSPYIAFDIFLRNITGSPYPDNLYLDKGTSVFFAQKTGTDFDGTINSLRFGFLKIGSVPTKYNVEATQNLKCNNNCEMAIYEPNSRLHSEQSIYRAKKYGVNLINGRFSPTYAIINNGKGLPIGSGLSGVDLPINPDYFAVQSTYIDFDRPLFKLPNGVTKFRIYVWIEGQDIDSLETISRGAAVSIIINFIKDQAGYN
ncbi:MAG: hypothetical protein RSB77_06215 [Bacilli bacterium]